MRGREAMYAGAIAVASVLALVTSLWWAALVVFAVAELALSLVDQDDVRAVTAVRAHREPQDELRRAT